MPVDNDTFGPWTPPGENGRPPEDDPGSTTGDGQPTTPATIVEEVPFWVTSTLGILDTGERSPWDRCKLGPHQLPGLAHVEISKPAERKIDVKSPDGKAKAKLTVKGWEPAEVQITLLLWTPPQLREWRIIRAELRDPNDEKESDPQEIVHPVTELEGIRAIMVKRPGAIEDGRIPGTKTVTILGIEWDAEPKDVGTKTPTGAKSAEGETENATRQDAEAAWLALVASGADVAWEDIAKAHGLEPPGPPPPIPPETGDDWDTPGYWEEDERTYE